MENQEITSPVIAKIDHGINWAARWFSYLGGIALLFMGIIAFINVIASKVFGHAIANVNELIDYCLILVVYCCVADCQLNGGGLIQVDIFFRLFPYGVKKLIKGIGYIAGVCIYTFAGYQAFSLLAKHIRVKTTASTAASSFVIWPFTLIYIIGTFVLALALLWSVIRMPFMPRPETELGPGDYDIDELNVKGKLFAEHPETDGKKGE
ncbi:MAG: TRAP transporter small permease [Oscillospiraceae bacterium]|nr:TRAP transporter small permease [Oscillospiraceae bacterium]